MSAAGRSCRRVPATRRLQAPRRKQLIKKLADTVTEEAAKHPDKPIEVWATDEHRLGLKPIHRRFGRRSGSGRLPSVTIATNGST